MNSDDMHIARALGDLAIFLEFTETALLNEDAAVQATEALAGALQQLSGRKKDQLFEAWDAISVQCEDSVQSDFLRKLPDHLGLR